MASPLEPLLEYGKVVSDGSLDYFGNPASRSKTGGPKIVNFVLGFFFFGTAALFGIGVSIALYIEKEYHVGDGVAATTVNNFIATSYLVSFLGGFLGDAYVGRFRAAAIFLAICILGLILFTISAAVPDLRPPPCPQGQEFCDNATSWQKAFFYISQYLVAIGYGGAEPCFTAFGAGQFDEEDPEELVHKSSFFNKQFLFFSCGSIIASTVLVYIVNNVSYALGFGACTISVAMAMVSVFLGLRSYRYPKLGKNPFTGIAQVFTAVARNAKLKTPDNPDLLYKGNEEGESIKNIQTASFRWLDKAAIRTDLSCNGAERNPWLLSTVAEVEEVKTFLSILPMCISTLLYGMVHMQDYSLFVTQSASMDTLIGGFNLPPGFFFTFNTVSAIVGTILYEYIIIPWLRRHSYEGPNTVQRTSFGLIFSTLAMFCAGVVEYVRLNLVKKYNLFHISTAPLTAFWVIPQFVFLGISEGLSYVGMTEFFYAEAPESLKGASSAIFLVFLAFGGFGCSAFINLVNTLTQTKDHPGWVADNPNRGHLDYYFFLLGSISALNVIYTYSLSRYRSSNQVPDVKDHEKG